MISDPQLVILTKHLEKQLQLSDTTNAALKKKLKFIQKNGNNFLSNLKQSTLNLWYRFYSSKPSISTNIIAFNEEVSEFLIEAERYHNNPNPETKQKLIEEAVDVLVTQLMILSGADVNIEEIENGIIKVIEKNDVKDHNSHAIDPETGKITRKSKLEEKYGIKNN